MPIHRLSWRIGLPFVLLVLAETVALGAYMNSRIASEEQQRIERTASAIAEFMAQRGYPTTRYFAQDLRSVTGYEVFFRAGGEADPPPWDDPARSVLAAIPTDGVMHEHGSFAAVATSIRGRHDLVIARRPGPNLGQPRILEALAAFCLLALVTAWIVGRGLVRPLRNLAAALPSIERTGVLELPEARRNDEMGELARSFLRTREALQREKDDRAKAEKFAVLGRMTAALAHEVQNPVAAIRMHAQLWRGGSDDEAAAIIEQQAGRIEDLLNQWMFLTRPEPPAVSTVDLVDLLERVTKSLRQQAEHARVRITIDAPESLVVQADAKRLFQVFSNLLTNAMQAMPHGGTVAITGHATRDHVEISVADQGTGFSPTALQRFAEFFYSEKEGGMGIGLTVASEIMNAHGGSLRVANREEGGAIVTALLPKRRAQP